MSFRTLILAMTLLMASRIHVLSQVPDSIFDLSAIIYDEQFFPVPASHVINLGSHQGAVTDSLGIFRLPVRYSDTLLIRNIAFRDTLVRVEDLIGWRRIVIRRRYYELKEARIFEWGSTYGDFKNAMVEMPNQQSLGESMGLPRQDPDYIPVEMNEAAIKSPAFLLSSPISFFYYNFNKQAQSARKVYWMEKNAPLQKAFDEIMGRDNLSSITGLTGNDLEEFVAFANERMRCDFRCSELQIYTEIYSLWELFQELEKRQMLHPGKTGRE